MKRALLALALVASMATSGWAVEVNLINNDSGIINGATFVFDKQQPTGSGVLNSFLRIQRNGTEQGYNTDAANNDLPFQEVGGGFTHSLEFSALQASNGYFLFVLDIAEGGGANSQLSLDGLKFFSTSSPTQNSNSTDVAGNASGIVGTLLYDMDLDDVDSYVLLDGNRNGNPGNGVSDMLLKMPESLFSAVGTNDYIILWSRFGLQEGLESNVSFESNASFEEWAHVTGNGGGTPVPEPSTFLLVGAALVGLGLYRRQRTK